MPATQTHWTVEMRNALPSDSNRYEVIDGELFVTPAPRMVHPVGLGALYLILAPYLRERKAGFAILSPADVEFSDDTVVEPDLFVIPPVNGRRPKDWHSAGHMMLAVEILSPSTARLDRVRKRALYQREGVDEYWIVDVDAREIHRWRPADERPEVLSERLVWQPAGVAADASLAIDLAALFAEIADDA